MSKRDKNKVNKERRASARAAASRTETRKSAGKTQRYDSEMIEDFLEQLMWELRIAHSEIGSRPGTCHPELLDQEVGFLSKYATYLLPTHYVEDDGATLAEWNRAGKTMLLQLRKQYADAIEHLEALRPMLEMALRGANPDHCEVQAHRASDLLACEDEGDDESSDDQYDEDDDDEGAWPDGDSCSR